MRSPFTADYPPPQEPPASLGPDVAPYWSVVAEQWCPDDDVRDRILAGMLARADQATIVPAVHQRMIAQAELVLADHRADDEGRCCLCTSQWDGRFDIPYPCWAVRLARLVLREGGTGR